MPVIIIPEPLKVDLGCIQISDFTLTMLNKKDEKSGERPKLQITFTQHVEEYTSIHSPRGGWSLRQKTISEILKERSKCRTITVVGTVLDYNYLRISLIGYEEGKRKANEFNFPKFFSIHRGKIKRYNQIKTAQ